MKKNLCIYRKNTLINEIGTVGYDILVQHILFETQKRHYNRYLIDNNNIKCLSGNNSKLIR